MEGLHERDSTKADTVEVAALSHAARHVYGYAGNVKARQIMEDLKHCRKAGVVVEVQDILGTEVDVPFCATGRLRVESAKLIDFIGFDSRLDTCMHDGWDCAGTRSNPSVTV